MGRFLCMARRGEAVATRGFHDSDLDDDPRVVVDGYEAPAGLLADERFESDLMLDGLRSLDVVTVEGDRVGPGWFPASSRVLEPAEVERIAAGPWLARLASVGDEHERRRATEILESVNGLPPA